MPSPFPGVDPYLETAELWPEVHSRLIVAIADQLSEQLNEQYWVAIEKRTYLETDLDPDESLLVGLPDVAILAQATATEPATAVATAEPTTVLLPMVETVQERYLEIREVATGAVITAIEILSPKNKRSGEGRQAYERKRNQVLLSLTHLVEVDLLRGGRSLPMQGAGASDYRILVSRSPDRPRAQLYGFDLRQPIPQVWVPLSPREPELPLELQPILNQVYRRGRYHLAIDYSQPLRPPLAPADADWAEALLRQQGAQAQN
ncbi:MAG: DUF4058 family protein [Pegethrix bostrychoides GSE-TBD4-15B]|jgi:hypothetical protein|uniref:DUF4058 family protein n=1 Tax=Pegethrix bostrychoides GSE-TBD4-15B TaxID=2839662 RepID=A0A951PAY9_9CYAN|nr:DUF4058 family protein [Pegethrix bostrychoides GSE-TBD4-15B]